MSAEPLFAVLLPTPDQERERPPAERVAAQSRGARVALSAAATLAGAPEDGYQVDELGVPVPQDGWHWSVSHDAEWVAGIVARRPVGIDLERRTERRAELVAAVVDEDERGLMSLGGVDDPALCFTRLWTAKEAFLKSMSVGLAKLSQCQVARPPEPETLTLAHAGRWHRVEQSYHAEHVAAVHAAEETTHEWSIAWSWRE